MIGIIPLVEIQKYDQAGLAAGCPDGEGVEFDPPLIGCSEKLRKLKRDVLRVAGSDISVLIEGESGTGKEIIARNIHRFSRRYDGPMVKVNCAEIQPSLLRAELFGFRKGSFTGAVDDRAGLVESAAGGTLFLDEVGEMQPELQAAVLRVIQEKEVRRLGESRIRNVDVRFVFATNRDIRKLVSSGSFREDLFFRICGLRLRVDPL
ncbi:MAG: AAA domain-containing protein, partial [Candidatus Latescibacteria bacterium]|nr:AAA domain-containing protein [Candidatus Latescibacterota bacterium]